ncbi:MAG: ABC transporter ATP-binding protein [Verrucomicrobia subdivision 3 bacterium]|nr:ABC transporter ATP-binding protein [Limisphaerales bacterium]
MRPAFLEVQSVSKAYGANGSRTEVLRDINLSIEEGEFVAIVGYSGAGKTTLMSILAGLLQPDAGEVKLEGQPVRSPGPDRGLVFQNYSLLPWLNVFENVKLAVDEVFPAKSEAERVAHTEEFVEMVNLTAAHDKKPSELSGGMRQRVSVARTLAMHPKILLCDEPLSALDALTRANLQDEIARLSATHKQTVVLITNDPDEAILLADRVIPLTAGPNATLGPSFRVDIARPRDRRALNHDPQFKQIRREVIEFLLRSRKHRQASVTRKLVLPEIEPEDLSVHRPKIGARRRPIRRSEVQREEIQIDP